MSELIIDNHVIKQDIKEILSTLKSELSNGKLSNIQYKGDEVSITCPFHKGGKENKPSCFIYVGEDEKIPWGTFHCFTCGEKGSLVKFIASAFDRNEYYAKEWLKKNFTEKVLEYKRLDIAEEITSKDLRKYPDYIPARDEAIKQIARMVDEDILNKLQSWHPYMEQRHISKEIANKFEVKYSPEKECLVFPVRDRNGELISATTRSVKDKKFNIPKSTEKTIYLLNECLKENCNQVVVCEGQIDALVSWSYGVPAIALFGAGTTEGQMKELNKTNIIHYILMYDNDSAGRKGANRFKKMIKKNVFVTDIIMPINKDVADCTKEEFLNILKNYEISID